MCLYFLFHMVFIKLSSIAPFVISMQGRVNEHL